MFPPYLSDEEGVLTMSVLNLWSTASSRQVANITFSCFFWDPLSWSLAPDLHYFEPAPDHGRKLLYCIDATAIGALSGGYLFELLGYDRSFLISSAQCIAVAISIYVMLPVRRPSLADQSEVVSENCNDQTAVNTSEVKSYFSLLGDFRILSGCFWGLFTFSVYALFEPTTSLHFTKSFPATKPRTSRSSTAVC